MVLSGALCFRWVFGQLIWGWSQKSEFQVDKKGPSPSWALTGSWEDGTNTALGALLAFFSLGKYWAGFSQSSDSKCVGWGMGLLTRQSRLAACHHWWGESGVPYRAPLLPPLARIAISTATVLIPPWSFLGVGVAQKLVHLSLPSSHSARYPTTDFTETDENSPYSHWTYFITCQPSVSVVSSITDSTSWTANIKEKLAYVVNIYRLPSYYSLK